jgi:GNAT superfamily N-acetyltransferase
MTAADVDPVSEMIERADWGARRPWFDFAVEHPQCQPIVAERDAELVGTGVATVNGPVGWVGTIFVAPELRGQGLGRALTQEVIDRLEASGCRSQVMLATEEGRRLYERMGFEVLEFERILEAPGLATAAVTTAPGEDAWRVRAFEPPDLDPMAALDRRGTGEDRRHALARFANPGSARVVADATGQIGGFMVRASWGGGATIAPTPGAALALLDARRRATGPTNRVRAGILASNRDGSAALRAAGFEEAWSAPRMIRGAPLDWRPDWIWGRFNHAMG